MQHEWNRREIIQRVGMTAVTSYLVTAGRAAWGLDPLNRVNPRIKGLSLTTYSLRRHMRWWWGERTEGELEIVDFLEYCAQLGLDGVELTSYFFSLPVESTTLNQIKRRAHLLGLDITGGAMGNDFGHPPDSEVAREQHEYTCRWIDHFADLGAAVVRVFATRRRLAEASDAEVLDNVEANLTRALAYAERRGVMLGLENHDFLQNIDYLLDLLGRFDSPWLGVVWDSANLAPTPDPYGQLARIAPYALVAQLKVMTHRDGEPVPADQARLVKILRDAGYGGYLVLEYEEEEDPYTAVPRFVEQLRGIIS